MTRAELNELLSSLDDWAKYEGIAGYRSGAGEMSLTKALRGAHEALVELTAWAAMATAPKDREIMVWRKDVLRPAFVIWEAGNYQMPNGGWYYERGEFLSEADLLGWREMPEARQ